MIDKAQVFSFVLCYYLEGARNGSRGGHYHGNGLFKEDGKSGRDEAPRLERPDAPKDANCDEHRDYDALSTEHVSRSVGSFSDLI